MKSFFTMLTVTMQDRNITRRMEAFRAQLWHGKGTQSWWNKIRNDSYDYWGSPLQNQPLKYDQAIMDHMGYSKCNQECSAANEGRALKMKEDWQI